MATLEYIFWGADLILTGFFLYYIFLAVAGVWPVSIPIRSTPLPERRFTILVPAHNEEKVILRTLDSLNGIDYPKSLFRIVVIADNCTDRTARIVSGAGLECLERTDLSNSGKGQALSWALSRLLPRKDADAFLVVDADTVVEPNLLQAMNRRLAEGAKVIQAYYDVLEPDGSPMAGFTFLGFAISRNLKYRGRSRLGWSVNLLGNGMCFSREVLERFGWSAFSISEDLEYQLQLLLKGITVAFAHETRVYAEMPSGLRAYHSQRSRWDIGKYRLRNRYLPQLVVRGIRERDPKFLDAALELVIPPYVLYAGASLAGFAVYWVAWGAGANGHFLLWSFLAAGIVFYTLSGLVLARAPARLYLRLLYVPFFLLWRLGIAVESFFVQGTRWVKTDRT